MCIALIELVDNAAEAMSGKGNIRVVLNRLELRQQVLLQVWSPTGPLIEELAERIFEEGYSTKGSERGMGLSIIRRLAKRFEGEVVLCQDDGVEFSVTVPYAQVGRIAGR
jgi:signal transduction histidine kinase